MAVPMRGREDTLGVLIVADKEGRGGTTLDFTDEDRVLLEAFANQAGVAIENAQLYQEALEGRQLQAE
ncbi:GAF domain-containing protein, partial [Candidatus Poribacteria bacterium]|nr:GAF domain-containing protein [Candidatus Poribacteria bacterium]